MHWWSKEEISWLREMYPKHALRELLPLFNEKFNVDVTYDQLKGTVSRYEIKSGRTGRFEKNQKAWNKGMKGLDLAGENGKKTQFKKGQVPQNYRPVGSERICSKDGYILVKVQDEGGYQERWKHKHRVIWEKHHGKIPDNHTVIFVDGNRENINIENLMLVSRSQLSQLNLRGFLTGDRNVLEAGLKLISLDEKIDDIEIKGGDLEKYNELLELANKNGISNGTFKARLRRGWSLGESATAPLHSRRK